jgi:hypothetical protein
MRTTFSVLRPAARIATAVLALCATATAGAQEIDTAEIERTLNAPLARVAEQSRSAPRVFTAYLDMTKPPKEVGADFNLTTIYPGMDGFDAVAKWAEANANMGKTLIDVQSAQILGVPYGTSGVDPKFVERGLIAEIAVDGDFARTRFPYLDALATINCYAVAEMYRLCEAGKFDEAFKIGLAHVRLLRQACDAQMFDEKATAMTMLADTFSVHRDILYVYGGKMDLQLLRDVATKEYPFLRPTDNERLKRIEMPEGDRVVAEAVLNAVFGADGQPDEEKFSAVFSEMQAEPAPMTTFGATKRWQSISGVHGSLDASTKKLEDIYDDYWRRWRMPPYNAMMDLPTVLSKTNPVKYAAVVLAARDLESLFELRRRLVAEFDGTVVAAGLCGYRQQFEDWPNDIEKAYTQFFPKRFDFDPYDKGYGHFKYDYLGTRSKGIDSEFGRIEAKGCMLYARNGDHEFTGGARHAVGGKSDDFVLWPALRAISRGQAE